LIANLVALLALEATLSDSETLVVEQNDETVGEPIEAVPFFKIANVGQIALEKRECGQLGQAVHGDAEFGVLGREFDANQIVDRNDFGIATTVELPQWFVVGAEKCENNALRRW
jgi:hypothetical protein